MNIGALLILALLYVLSIVFIVLDITLIDVYKNKKMLLIFSVSATCFYILFGIFMHEILISIILILIKILSIVVDSDIDKIGIR